MQQRVRNIGRSGIAATAISALDCALWDVKARLLDMPLARLLGAARSHVPLYGSGGFTTYTDDEVRDQLDRWVHEDGCRWVKIKIGTEPVRDPHRVEVARDAIGAQAGLFVDANGALDRKQALFYAQEFAQYGVEWFEEPVSSDDVAGLALLRKAWNWPPGNMATRLTIFACCLPMKPSMSCRRTSPAAAASPASCAWPRSAMPFMCRSRRIAHPRCIFMSRARRRGCGIRNGFTITYASNQCSSKAHHVRATAPLRRTGRGPAAGSTSNMRMGTGMRFETRGTRHEK
jgi:hypothetical protein